MLQLGATEDETEKPQFAPMPKGVKIENVTLDQALKAFELPRLVGQTEDGKDIKANIGRFGPYIQVEKLFVSIKLLDPHTITLEEALEHYSAKLKAEAEKNIADFGDGKIPKDTDPKSITHDEAKKMLKEAPAKKSFKRRSSSKKK